MDRPAAANRQTRFSSSFSHPCDSQQSASALLTRKPSILFRIRPLAPLSLPCREWEEVEDFSDRTNCNGKIEVIQGNGTKNREKWNADCGEIATRSPNPKDKTLFTSPRK